MPRNTPTSGTADLIETIKTLVQPLVPKPTGVRPKIRHLAGIKAVLFDIYGTLLISGAGDISHGMEANKVREFMAAAQAVGWNVADTRTAALFLTAWRKKIHALRHNLRRNGMAYPEIDIEFVVQIGEFGPDLIHKLSREWKIPPNFMFIASPGDEFLYGLAELGGVRLII